jgi:hypothetical protein
MQESVSPVHFIIINSMQLKDAIVECCHLWQDKLAKLLLRLTYDKIWDSYRYTSENTEKYELLVFCKKYGIMKVKSLSISV